MYPGDTWSYQWNNSNPYWFNNMHMNWASNRYYVGAMLSFSKHMPVEIASFVSGDDTKWTPGSADQWQIESGPNFQEPDNGVPRKHPTPGRSLLSQMPMAPSSPPPLCVIEIPPLLKSKNEGGKVVWQCMAVYEVTLQIETMSGLPQFIGWHTQRPCAGESKYPTMMSRRRTQLCQWPTGLRNYGYPLTDKKHYQHSYANHVLCSRTMATNESNNTKLISSGTSNIHNLTCS